MKTKRRDGETARRRIGITRPLFAWPPCSTYCDRFTHRAVAQSPRRRFAVSCRPTGANKGGFILWEVLLAFGIFCLVSVGFIAALEQTIFTVTLVRDESEVRRSFENFFAEARAEKLQPGTQALNGADNRVQYERQVQTVKAKNQQGADVTNLFEIKLTARWTLQNRERTEEAKIIVYQP
jgi:type II secretory pathway pseudopilin PulG